MSVVALTVGTALAAAVAFGWSAALMHHSASQAPQGGTVALLKHLVGQWRWLAGMAASLTGLLLHALALHLGSLALVQPLVVSGLIFSFVFRSALDRRLPSRWLMTWVSVTAAGLAVFLLAASSTHSSARLDGSAAALMFGAGAVLAGLTCAASQRVRPDRAGLLLGVSGGIVFGLIAGALKATTDIAGHGLQLFTSWPLYVLIALGAAGFLLNQRAYHKAPLSQSLPALNMINPLVAVAFGIAAFHEQPSVHSATILTECFGLSFVLAGIFFLARTEEISAQA